MARCTSVLHWHLIVGYAVAAAVFHSALSQSKLLQRSRQLQQSQLESQRSKELGKKKYDPAHPEALAHLLTAIEDEKEQLSKRLEHVGVELQNARSRLQTDTQAAKGTLATFAQFEERVDSTLAMSRETEQTISDLQNTDNAIVSRTDALTNGLDEVNKTLDSAARHLSESADIRSAEKRADDNLRTIEILEPRLIELQSGIGDVEFRLASGNITRLVDRVVGKDLQTAAEDTGRSLSHLFDPAK